MWLHQAGALNGLPLDDRSALEVLGTERPQPGKPRDHYVYYPHTAEVPESVAVNIRGRSFTIAAAAILEPGAEGVLFAHGGVAGGHSLFLRDGHLHYVYNWLGERIQSVTSASPVGEGRRVLTAEFSKTGDDQETPSALGDLRLFVDTDQVGQAEIITQPGWFALTGDGLCIGRDSGSPVADYRPPFSFSGGEIERVVIDVSGDPYVDHEKQVLAWLARD